MTRQRKAALSAVLLGVITVFLSLELVYSQVRLGPAAVFSFHHGLKSTAQTGWGLFYTAIAVVTAWRKIGLSHVASVLTSVALAMAVFNTTAIYKTEFAIVSATVLVYAAVWLLRRTRFIEKPMWPLFGIGWIATVYQSAIYKVFFPTYVLTGAVIYKTIMVALAAGLTWAALTREEVT